MLSETLWIQPWVLSSNSMQTVSYLSLSVAYRYRAEYLLGRKLFVFNVLTVVSQEINTVRFRTPHCLNNRLSVEYISYNLLISEHDWRSIFIILLQFLLYLHVIIQPTFNSLHCMNLTSPTFENFLKLTILILCLTFNNCILSFYL